MLDRPALEDTLMHNVFFDTCVYHQPGINLLFDVISADNILFGSEMVGAVRGIDPQTGHYFDDTRRYIDALHLDPGERAKVFELNARRAYPRLDAALKARNQQAGAGSPTTSPGPPSTAGAATAPRRSDQAWTNDRSR